MSKKTSDSNEKSEQETTKQPQHFPLEPLLSEEMPVRSKEQKELFTAMAKAQADMPIAVRSSMNPYYTASYASFADIIKASRGVLSKHGLSVSQDIIERENGQKYLYTVLMHASGQFKASRIKLSPPRPDIQQFGYYLSCIKRYTYAALIGVADIGEDDDGETLMEDVREQRTKSPEYRKKAPVPLPSEETISREQLSILNEELDDYPDMIDLILDGFKIQTLADMPKQQFSFTLKRIRKIKEAQNRGEEHEVVNTGASDSNS